MPSVNKSRVKTTGKGEIYYADEDTLSTSNVATPTEEGDTQTYFLSGDNIGYGHGIFAGVNGDESNTIMEFKSLVAGTGIFLTSTDSVITISTTSNTIGNGSSIANGLMLPLGNTNFAGGAVNLTENMDTTSAINDINKLLGLLVPPAPTAFPNAALTIANLNGNQPLLAAAVPNNTDSGAPAAGNAVNRVSGLVVSSNNFNDIGPVSNGTLSLMLNDSPASIITLDGNAHSVTGLVVSDLKNFPANVAGFWKSMDVAVVNRSVSAGVNKMKIVHSAAGNTNNVYFVTDTMTSTPNLVSTGLAQASAGTFAYSSGVPHYGTGGQLIVQGSITNLAGNTYYGGSDPLSVSGTNSIINAQSFTYSNLGINTPIAKDTTAATPITSILVNVDGSVHDVGLVQGIVKNVNGQSSATNLANTKILVKRGSASSTRIDEMAVPVTGLGNNPNANSAVRVSILSNSDTPAASHGTWASNATLVNYEAAVVGGILAHDQTDYSVGFLPVGPNLSSGRNGTQYATFAFNRAVVSQFKINVIGTYSGCWVKLPGVSDSGSISPNSANGWWNAFLPYNGAGVPGNISDSSAGIAVGSVMSGASGSYNVTFGPQSSTNSIGNIILVRFKLTAGQKITALSFTN